MDPLKEFKGKNVLLLQSQFIFFKRLSKDLRKVAKSVHKINFNGGDWIFYPFGAVNYTGKPGEIGNFLKDYIVQNDIDAVVVFNDCKPVHRIAKKAIQNLKVDLYVFEQGYIRPDFITFEKGGVNGYSSLPKDANFYKRIDLSKKIDITEIGEVSMYRFLYSTVYYLFFNLLKPIFKSSDFSVPKINKYALGLLKGRFLKFYYDKIQNSKIENFINKYKNNYYFVPLQMSVDSQIRMHSPYQDVYEFIEDILVSFSSHAPKDTYLVFKHHPFDLGLNDYTDYIYKRSLMLGISDRVKYFKSGCIDLLIANSIGCVMVNSTCGMTALRHRKPLKIMGNAIYDIDGIVYKNALNNFWQDSFVFIPDSNLIENFTSYVILNTQANGSFYRKITKENRCGIKFFSDTFMYPINKEKKFLLEKGALYEIK